MNIATIRNQFLIIGQHWQRSLAVFLPENFSRFILVSLNAFIKSTKTFFLYFWWMPLIPCFFAPQPFELFGFAVNWPVLWRMLQWFFIFLAVRPSVDLKTARYYGAWLPRFVEFASFILLIGAIQWGISSIDSWLPLPIFAWFFGRILFIFHNLVAFMIIPSPLLLFAGFFLLDSSASVHYVLQSAWRSFNMILYTYPFCLMSLVALVLLFFVGDFVVALIIRFLPAMLRCIIDNLFITFYHILVASWFSTVYIKRAHEDFSLYS